MPSYTEIIVAILWYVLKSFILVEEWKILYFLIPCQPILLPRLVFSYVLPQKGSQPATFATPAGVADLCCIPQILWKGIIQCILTWKMDISTKLFLRSTKSKWSKLTYTFAYKQAASMPAHSFPEHPKSLSWGRQMDYGVVAWKVISSNRLPEEMQVYVHVVSEYNWFHFGTCLVYSCMFVCKCIFC